MIHAPLDLILKRRADIQGVIADLTSRIERLRQELEELDVAERVFGRLEATETADTASFTGMATDESASVTKPHGIPTMPEMILEVLRGQAIPVGMEPREILQDIATKWWRDVQPENVGPIAWRMWRRGQLDKQGTRYLLPQTNETVDADPGRESSTVSVSIPAQGREAGPGGGT